MKIYKKFAYLLATSASLVFSPKVYDFLSQRKSIPNRFFQFNKLLSGYPFQSARCLDNKYTDDKMLIEINSNITNYLISKLRDPNTNTPKFRHFSKRLIRILIQQTLSQDIIYQEDQTKISLTKTPYHPYQLKYSEEEICVVSIMRSGDSLVDQFMKIIPNCAVGKILLQRQEQKRDKRPEFYYSKFPKSLLSMKRVFLLDPMLATGGSASMAIEKLKERGVEEQKIVFVNIIACPQGIKVLRSQYPKIKIVTAVVDEGLNDDKFILPGLGDFGDRYFGSSL